MMRFVLSALAVMMLTGGVASAAPANMPAGDYQILDRAIQNALNQSRPDDHPWNARNGVSGVISTKGETPRRRWPGCSGAECDHVCRRYEFTYNKNGKSAEFNGVRCRAPTGGSSQWRLLSERFASGDALPFAVAAAAPSRTPSSRRTPGVRTPPAQAPATSAPQSPAYDKTVVTAIQRALASLLYYGGEIDGQFGPGAQSALKEFLADYRKSAAAEPTTEVQTLVEAAVATTLSATDCDYVSGAGYGVCGSFK